LLHILDHQLKTQTAKTGRPGFELLVVFVDVSAVERYTPDPTMMSQLQSRFKEHSYAIVSLEDILNESNSDAGQAPMADLPDVKTENESSPTRDRLESLITSLISATARADVISTLRTRLIVKYAREHGCEGILWGDSTTRLAEKTLAETAKGRGFSLPWQVADGQTPHGIAFRYPLRDVLKKELIAHAGFIDPPLTEVIHKPTASGPLSTSSKNTTINDLMKQYFESVEENYPSIVANVVRTVTKLEAPSCQDIDEHCSLCNMPVPEAKFGIHGWGGDQHDVLGIRPGEQRETLCYGCTRSAPQGTRLPA
jgi:cytoplasmic tRNA 2-thiolation protein 2